MTRELDLLRRHAKHDVLGEERRQCVDVAALPGGQESIQDVVVTLVSKKFARIIPVIWSA